MSPTPIRVFLIDDHPIVRAGARLAVGGMPGFEVCGEAGSAAGAADSAKSAGAHVVVADLLLGDAGDGMTLVSTLRAALPNARILVFSMNAEEIFAERAIKAGADGYLMKGGDLSELQEAIRKIQSGGRYLSPSLEAAAVAPTGSAKKALSSLSEREMQVFLLLGSGKSTQQIATELGVSMKTASAHRENLKLKLGLESGPELVRFAVAYVVGQGRTN